MFIACKQLSYVFKRILLRGKFRKVPFDKELPTRVVRLAYKVVNLRQTYDDMTLLCALESALPHEVADTYNTSGQDNLTTILEELVMRYKSPGLTSVPH